MLGLRRRLFEGLSARGRRKVTLLFPRFTKAIVGVLVGFERGKRRSVMGPAPPAVSPPRKCGPTTALEAQEGRASCESGLAASPPGPDLGAPARWHSSWR